MRPCFAGSEKVPFLMGEPVDTAGVAPAIDENNISPCSNGLLSNVTSP
ncbi:MAG: hypothetical protein LBF88_02690 [Planctomycetaceae bacterium]|nr:hypothetical protein [Planctomycetaceae bacterium]